MPAASLSVSEDQAALLHRLLAGSDGEQPRQLEPDKHASPPADPSTSLWLGLAAYAAPPPGYLSDHDESGQSDLDWAQQQEDAQAAVLSDVAPHAVEAVASLDQLLATQFSDPSAAQGVRHSVRALLFSENTEAAASELAELLGFEHLDLASALVLHRSDAARILDPNPPPAPPRSPASAARVRTVIS